MVSISMTMVTMVYVTMMGQRPRNLTMMDRSRNITMMTCTTMSKIRDGVLLVVMLVMVVMVVKAV